MFSDHICGKATMGLSWGCHRHGERISNKTYKPSKNVSLRSCRSSLLDRSFFVFNNGVFAFPSPRPLAWPPAPCLAPGPGPQFVFTGPGLQFVFTDPGPQFVFNSPGSEFVFTGPGPKFVFSGPGSKFVFAGPGL